MATGGHNFIVGELETLLTCSICFERLCEPRTLPCFHTFCKHCLEKFVNGLRNKELEIQKFSCPTCRSEFSLQLEEEVLEIGSSHFIRNMLGVMSVIQEATISKCSRCEEQALCRCIECEIFICEKCFDVHEKWYNQKKHTVVRISEISDPENKAKLKSKLYCTKHQNKAMKFYCTICQELVCRYCMEFNHLRQDHICKPLSEVCGEHRKILESNCVKLDQYLKEGTETLNLISHTKQCLEDSVKTTKYEIGQRQQEILQSVLQNIEDKTTFLLTEVDKKHNEISEALLKQEAEVKIFIEKINSCLNLATNLIENGNSEEILSSQKELEENIERMIKEKPYNMKPVHNGFIKYEMGEMDNSIEELCTKLGNIVEDSKIRIFPVVQLGSFILERVISNTAEYQRKIVIGIGNESGYKWEALNVYLFSGTSDEELPTHVDNNMAILYAAWKTRGSVAGVVGILSYYILDKNLTIEVLFSVPYDYKLYSNWWDVSIYRGKSQANYGRYISLYNGDPFKGDNQYHNKHIGYGFEINNGLMNSDGIAKLMITIKSQDVDHPLKTT